MSFSALVLAGSRAEGDPVAAAAGVSAKALAEVGGAPMLTRVVAAVRAAGAARVAVAASDPSIEALARALGCELVESAAGPSESAARGFALLGAPMLLTTADHALLEPAWVTQFVAGVGDADAAVLLARREVIEAAVPETRRTYLRFADGDWSGCNLFYFARAEGAAAFGLWQAVERDRKRPWRIALRLGPGLLLRYLFGRLTLAAGVARLGQLAGLRAAAVESPFGLAAVDVDKAEDLSLARRIAEAQLG